MSDEENYSTYLEEYEDRRRESRDRSADAAQKAFDYGVLVVKQALLVSGGGLLSIPAIVGLSSNLELETDWAVYAALGFAASLVTALIGSYVIHLNWNLHSEAWENWLIDENEFLKAYYLEGKSGDELPERQAVRQLDWKIWVTFWVPHILVLIYLALLVFAFVAIYFAFGIKV